MSIATQRGDAGETALAGGARVSKADPRIEAYGVIDEVISALGFARSICPEEDIRTRTREIQRELFKVGSAMGTPPNSKRPIPAVEDGLVERLTADVHDVEAIHGILSDWSIPGEDPASAAYDVARTVCRRAERVAVGLSRHDVLIQPNVLRYLNRLSDLLWLYGRLIDHRRGRDPRLRDEQHPGPRWSRAW